MATVTVARTGSEYIDRVFNLDTKQSTVDNRQRLNERTVIYPPRTLANGFIRFQNPGVTDVEAFAAHYIRRSATKFHGIFLDSQLDSVSSIQKWMAIRISINPHTATRQNLIMFAQKSGIATGSMNILDLVESTAISKVVQQHKRDPSSLYTETEMSFIIQTVKRLQEMDNKQS